MEIEMDNDRNYLAALHKAKRQHVKLNDWKNALNETSGNNDGTLSRYITLRVERIMRIKTKYAMNGLSLEQSTPSIHMDDTLHTLFSNWFSIQSLSGQWYRNLLKGLR